METKGKNKSLVAAVGAVATLVKMVMYVIRIVPGLAGWFGSLFRKRKRVYVWMLTNPSPSGQVLEGDVKDFKAELARVVGGANCIVTALDVRLLEVKLDLDGFVVVVQEKKVGEG